MTIIPRAPRVYDFKIWDEALDTYEPQAAICGDMRVELAVELLLKKLPNGRQLNWHIILHKDDQVHENDSIFELRVTEQDNGWIVSTHRVAVWNARERLDDLVAALNEKALNSATDESKYFTMLAAEIDVEIRTARRNGIDQDFDSAMEEAFKGTGYWHDGVHVRNSMF